MEHCIVWMRLVRWLFQVTGILVALSGAWLHAAATKPSITTPQNRNIVLLPHLATTNEAAPVGYPLLLEASINLSSAETIKHVHFFCEGKQFATLTKGPFLVTYIPTNPGPYRFTAKVLTDRSPDLESRPVTVKAAPRLEALWEDPRVEEWIPLGSTRTLSIRLTDLGGVFDKATFLANSSVIEETDYTHVDWKPSVAGSYQLQVRVTDEFGNHYLTPALTMQVAGLEPPRARFVTPGPWQRFQSGRPVVFEIQAEDRDGTVTNLALVRTSVPQAESSNGSLAYAWPDLPPGQHEFRAIATDNHGLTFSTNLHLIVDLPLDAGLPPPIGFSVEQLGSSAARLRCANQPPSVDLVLVEHSQGTNTWWEPSGLFRPPHELEFIRHLLSPGTSHRFRAYSQSSDGKRSSDTAVKTLGGR